MTGEDAVAYGVAICAIAVTAAAIAMNLPVWAWLIGMGCILLAAGFAVSM